MNAPLARTFRLVPRGGAGLACDDDGVALGPVSLVEAWRDEGGKLRFRAKPLAEVGKAMRLAYGDAENETVARHHRGLSRIAELLAAGEGTRARIHAVQLGFGDIDDDGMAKLARALTLRKFNLDWAGEDRGIGDPEQFATVLQAHKKYGINPDNGEPMPGFVHDTATTIRGSRPYIERSRARR